MAVSNDFERYFQRYTKEGLKELGLELPPETLEKLFRFFSLLKELGKPLGLTALEDPLDFAVKHLLDSLTILPFLPEGALLDLGTGAGLPGMVIKIVQPEREVWLVDARKKPISFLTYATGVLSLPPPQIIQASVGEKNAPLPLNYFEVIVSRAVSDLGTLWKLARPHLRPQGLLLAMKGPKAREEIAKLLEQYPSLEIKKHSLRLPLTGNERHIVLVKESPSSNS